MPPPRQHVRLLFLSVVSVAISCCAATADDQVYDAVQVLKTYCFDCHSDTDGEAGVDLSWLTRQSNVDSSLVFENIATGKMPPADADQPSTGERRAVLKWLADNQGMVALPEFRRLSRHEFVHSLNDLLGIQLNVTQTIPDDRGTRNFDTDRRIQLTSETLSRYFATADHMLNHALPADGFPNEHIHVTNKLKDSHFSYNIYVRDYLDGNLFSWTRANNGNSYSFFYDNFEPPEAGWYDLTFDAMKVADFDDDISIQVHAGKYYYADDRPQPQRLLGVISLSNQELESHTIRAFLNPGENVSVHCYSQHTFRQKPPEQGAYIRQLTARGPVYATWPPPSYALLFHELPLGTTPRKTIRSTRFQTNLQRIGGSVTVSSSQEGMEKENMQDGSNRTFWHTRFTPTVATGPHYVVLENPQGTPVTGLSYATWSGGNGNGQVTKYSVSVSDDGQTWSDPIAEGTLEVRLANEQPIHFATAVTKRFIRFLILDALSLDGKSLASIGKLDVVVSRPSESRRNAVSVLSESNDDLRKVVKRFAERAFAKTLTDDELAPCYDVSIRSLKQHGDILQAAKVGFKAIVCSPRFLLVHGGPWTESSSITTSLARVLWRSVPDESLQQNEGRRNTGRRRTEAAEPSRRELQHQIAKMLADQRSNRMVDSFCGQWLNLRSWNKVAPSLKLYPKYDDLLHHYLPIETKAYVAHLIRENRPVIELIESRYAFLNQRLARHYGIDGVLGQHIRKVALAADVPRGGLLTMGSILKVTTDGFDTSPILRGAWVSKNIVGTPLSPPPESVTAIEAEHGEAVTTLKEQIEQHKSNAACYACHRHIDPYGFALESFDSTGQWRTTYRKETAHSGTFQFRLEGYYQDGANVDSSGEIGQATFEDVFGFRRLLASNHRRIAYNFAKKFFEYANGYAPRLSQRVMLLGMISDNPNECRVRDLITEILVYSVTGKTNAAE